MEQQILSIATNVDNFDPIKAFKKFEKRSKKKWEKTLNRIKDDKKYLGGEQLSKEDIEILGQDRSKNKLNIVANAVRTIVNTYREQPYRWRVVDNSTNQDSEILNQAAPASEAPAFPVEIPQADPTQE